MRVIFTVLILVLSSGANAYKQQTAKISEFYVHAEGSIALKLDGGFSDLVKEECPGNNGYAGSRTADPILKSFILAQYVAGKEVKIGFSGCDQNWIKIIDTRGF